MGVTLSCRIVGFGDRLSDWTVLRKDGKDGGQDAKW